jgi:hypothetical protein
LEVSSLTDWQQGDCSLSVSGFLYRFDTQEPATSEAQGAAGESDVVEVAVPGLVLITQTCDVQRVVAERPFVTLCALIACPDGIDLEDIRKCLRPRYVYLPGVAARGLIADLDQVMTVEKPLLKSWARTRGCESDGDQRTFAAAVARKFERFAFPDDFIALMSDFTDLVKRKHGRMQSDEGQALVSLEEIRVAASPDWNAQAVQLQFMFVRRQDQTAPPGKAWSYWLAKWLAKIPPGGRFAEVHGVVLPLSQIRADEYVASDRLDLDHLSKTLEADAP